MADRISYERKKCCVSGSKPRLAPSLRHIPAAVLETALFLLIAAALLTATLWNCVKYPTDPFYIRNFGGGSNSPVPTASFDEIVMITQNTGHCYYSYRDQDMGFEYDLAQAFADSLGVKLTVRLADDWKGMLSILRETPNAFIAAGMMMTQVRRHQAAFSEAYMTSQQHIIVHRDNREISHPEDLGGRTVYVWKDTLYKESLEALKDRGIDVQIVACEDISAEELLQKVANKTIDIAMADSYVALQSRLYYPQLVVREAISNETEMGWAVEKSDEELLTRINQFFKTIRGDGRFKEIYDRYYASVTDFDFIDVEAYHSRLEKRLPKYQTVIRQAAESCGFDWYLIAAQIYQESHFDPKANRLSHTFGLMQLTKLVAEHFKVKDIYNPEENVLAGVRHLKDLYESFPEADPSDRMALALAAYNIGRGHILDARSLAREQNLDPNKWSSIAETLPLLCLRKYYRQSTYGYCRGTMPVEYVKQTLLYYDILKHKEIAGEQDSQPMG